VKKKRKLKLLRKDAEAIFHKWIVKRDKGICFTCGNSGTQAGHFCHSRLDFDEINLNCQCVRCNHFLSGNLGIYALFLDKKYGAGTAEALIYRSKQQPNKFDRTELEEFIKKYGQGV
jgi:regulator of sigma D